MSAGVLLAVQQPLDLATTLSSGQSFRWRQDDGAWVGVLGGDVVRLRQDAQGIWVESAPTSPEQVTARLASY